MSTPGSEEVYNPRLLAAEDLIPEDWQRHSDCVAGQELKGPRSQRLGVAEPVVVDAERGLRTVKQDVDEQCCYLTWIY